MTRYWAWLIVLPIALGLLLAAILLNRGTRPEPVEHGTDIHAMQVATHDFGVFVSTNAAGERFAEELDEREERIAEARRKRRVRTASASGAIAAVPSSQRGYPCGGDLPPCWVLRRESLMAADPVRVWNGNCYMPVGSLGQCGRSTASGLWQVLRSTWRGYAGYVNAADAPMSVQNDFARMLWNGGRGCAHWAACG